MLRIAESFNFGRDLPEELKKLYTQLDRMYSTLARGINVKTRTYTSTSAPSASAQINKEFDIGDSWIKTDTNKVYILTSRTSDIDVTWSLMN